MIDSRYSSAAYRSKYHSQVDARPKVDKSEAKTKCKLTLVRSEPRISHEIAAYPTNFAQFLSVISFTQPVDVRVNKGVIFTHIIV